MTLPSSGALSLNAIHVEAGGSSGSQASINDSDIRVLIGKGSGATMSFSEWYGASREITLTSAGLVNGQKQRKQITISNFISSGGILVVPSDIWVWSDSTSTAALIIDIPCTLKNYGKIIGRGGNGASVSSNGNAGGPAIRVQSSGVSIINYSGAFIAGGGGSGARGGGGGAGGGSGGTGYGTGGSGGSLNASGSNGSTNWAFGVMAGGGAGGAGGYQSGSVTLGAGGGGRILSGTGGGFISINGGNIREGLRDPVGQGGAGGSDGGDGGTQGDAARVAGGGGWGASGGDAWSGAVGGSGGAAVQKTTSFSLSNSGTIYGAT